MIATASKPIRKRRQTRAHRPRRTGSVYAKPLLYADFLPMVQVGPNLYHGYFGMAMGSDPSGMAWAIWSYIPIIRSFVTAMSDPKGSSVSDYVFEHLDKCSIDKDEAERLCKNSMDTQAARYAVRYHAHLLTTGAVEAITGLVIGRIGHPIAIAIGGGLVLDGIINTLIGLHKVDKIQAAADRAKAWCVCPNEIACVNDDGPIVMTSFTIGNFQGLAAR